MKIPANQTPHLGQFPVLLETVPGIDSRWETNGHPSNVCAGVYVPTDFLPDDDVIVTDRVAFEPADEHQPTPLPNGGVAFLSDRDKIPAVYVADPRRDAPPRLLFQREDLDECRFAPDGSGMAYVTRNWDTAAQLWLAQSDGSQPRQVLNGLDPEDIGYTPDSRWLIFSGGVPEDRSSHGLYRLNLETGETEQVLQGSVRRPCLSPDGRKVAFLSSPTFEESGLYCYDLASGEKQRLTSWIPSGWPTSLSFCPDGSRLVLVSGSGEPGGFWSTVGFVAPAAGGEFERMWGLSRDDDEILRLEFIPTPPSQAA